MAFAYWVAPCTEVGLGEGCLMGSVCDSSLKFISLSSLTYNKTGLVSFASSHLSSLLTWFVYFAIFSIVMGWCNECLITSFSLI